MLWPIRTRLNRRQFLALSGTVAASLLGACSSDSEDEAATPEPESTPTAESDPDPTATAAPTPTATPTPEPEPTPTPTPTSTPEPPAVSYWVEPELEGRSGALIQQLVDALEREFSASDIDFVEEGSADSATILLHGPEENDDTALVYGEALIPIAAPDQLAPSLSRDQLREMFDGSIANWLEVDGHDRQVAPVVHPAAESTGMSSETRVSSSEELAERAGELPGIIALVPRSLVSFHVQALQVDDIDPLRDELRPDTWPWWEQIGVTIQPSGENGYRQRIADEIDEINTAAIAPRRAMLSAVGDVALGRTVHTIMAREDDWRAPFTLVDDELQRGDLTIGNLECAITGSFAPPEDPTTFSFMTFPQATEGLEFAGFNALSGANNHAMDFGLTGVRDTINALAERGIEHFGAGDTLDEARAPCILEHEGVRFALLGYDSISMNYAGATAESGGVAPMLQEYVVEDIQRAREQADVVIPFFHWGVEYTLTPTDGDRQMAHAAIDAGADLVLGGHPHWVQGMEIYQNRPIFYSLSNFVFDQEWSLETKQGFILHLIFDEARFVGYRIVPVLIEDFHRPRLVEDDVRATILGRFWESTRVIGEGG